MQFERYNSLHHDVVASSAALSPLINLEMQHDGNSAQVWMKRVLLLFVVVMGGRKGFAREHKIGFYET